MNNSFLALIFRQKYIKRWALMRNFETEDLQQHAAETAYIAHMLAVIKNKFYGGEVNAEKIALYALYHDVPEILTGDLPTPVKYFSPEMRNTYSEIEKNAEQTLLSKLPKELREEFVPLINQDLTEDERKLVKTADKLSALIKCLVEEKDGNAEFAKARTSTEAALEKLDSPELRYFTEHFIPSFKLPLDDM